MGFSRQEYWSGLPFPSPVDHILSDLSTMTLPSWVAPRAWLTFIELDKAVVLVWLDWLVFCEYGFSVCPLMPSCNTYRLTWVSLTLGVGCLFTAAPAKCSHCSYLYLNMDSFTNILLRIFGPIFIRDLDCSFLVLSLDLSISVRWLHKKSWVIFFFLFLKVIYVE